VRDAVDPERYVIEETHFECMASLLKIVVDPSICTQ
jgi:hypothetical protein